MKWFYTFYHFDIVYCNVLCNRLTSPASSTSNDMWIFEMISIHVANCPGYKNVGRPGFECHEFPQNHTALWCEFLRL